MVCNVVFFFLYSILRPEYYWFVRFEEIANPEVPCMQTVEMQFYSGKVVRLVTGALRCCLCDHLMKTQRQILKTITQFDRVSTYLAPKLLDNTTSLTSSFGDETTILRGHLSQEKVQPFAESKGSVFISQFGFKTLSIDTVHGIEPTQQSSFLVWSALNLPCSIPSLWFSRKSVKQKQQNISSKN